MGKKLLKVRKINLADNPIEFHYYSVKVNFNYEQKAADNILALAKGRGFEDKFKDVIIPIIETTETVLDKNGNAKQKKKRNKVWGYDGYIFVNMVLNNETWALVRNATGVAGWLNADGRPNALLDEEVENVKKACGYIEEKIVVDFKGNFGDKVEIVNGPMKGLTGEIVDMTADKEITILASNGFKIEANAEQLKLV